MTQMTRKILTAALVLAALGLLASLCWTAAQNTERNAPQVQQAASVAEVQMTRIDAVPAVQPLSEDQAFLAGLADGQDFTVGQAARLAEAGHLVCDGLTDDVPVSTMTGVLMAQYRLTGDEAMTLVNAAGTTLCV